MTCTPEIRSYDDAQKFLGNRRRRTHPAKHTYIEKRNSGFEIAVAYHSTAVITYLSTGSVILKNGGYLTRSTKRRINTFLPLGFCVSQKAGTWYVHDTRSAGSDHEIAFSSGMIINPNRGPGEAFSN